MKLYIAGSITGDPNAKEKFNAARAHFPSTDKVMLPTFLPGGMKYDDYMPICFAMISVADKVAFLPDWRESRGAKVEHEYCRLLSKPIIYL